GCGDSRSADTARTAASWRRSPVRPWPAGAVRTPTSIGQFPPARKHAASRCLAYRRRHTVRGVPAGLPFFSVDLLHDLDLEVPLRQQLLQLAILGGERLQLLHFRRLQLPEVLAPDVDRLLADPVLLGDLGHRRTVGLTQDRHHLLVGKSALSHRLFLLGEEPSFQKSADRKRQAGQVTSRTLDNADRNPSAAKDAIW